MPFARIPKIVHMTCPDADRIENPVWAQCVAEWRRLHPDYEIRIRGDKEAAAFIRRHAPHALERWSAMPIGAVRADVYRYLALYVEGGVYADMDCEPLRSIESLRAQYDEPGGPPPVVLGMEIGDEHHANMKSPGSLIPIRADPRWTYRGLCLCQWCMLAAPKSDAMHQAFHKAVGGTSRILKALKRGKCIHETVTTSTGPVAMTRAVLGSPITRRGVRIVTSEFFCGGSHGRVPLTEKAYVRHHFTASWKTR